MWLSTQLRIWPHKKHHIHHFFRCSLTSSDIFRCTYAYFISCIKWLESFFQTIHYTTVSLRVSYYLLYFQNMVYHILQSLQISLLKQTCSALWRAGNIRSANHGKNFDGCSNYLGIYVTKIVQQTIPSTVNFILVFQLRSQRGSRCYPSFNRFLPGAANFCVTWKS